MTSPVPSAAPRSRFRALPLLGWALGVAGLVWGAVQVWQAQPAVSAQAVKAAPSPEPLEDVAFRALRGRLREPAAAAFQDVRVHRFGPRTSAPCAAAWSRRAKRRRAARISWCG